MIFNLPWSPSQIEPGRIPLQFHDQGPEVDKPPFRQKSVCELEKYSFEWL